MEVFNVLLSFAILVLTVMATTIAGGIYSLLETPSSASTSRTYVRMPSPVVIAKRRAPEHLPSERAMENELMAARFNPFEHELSAAIDFWPEVVEDNREEWRVANVKEEIVLHDGWIIDATDYPDPVCTTDMWPLDNAVELIELPGEIVLGEGVRFGSRVIEILECEEDPTVAPEPPVYKEVERKFRLWQARQVTQEVIELLHSNREDLWDVPF